MKKVLLTIGCCLGLAALAHGQYPAQPPASTTAPVSPDAVPGNPFGPSAVGAFVDQYPSTWQYFGDYPAFDNRLNVKVDYLLWWFKNAPVPVPLVTSAPATSAAKFPGAIGNPDTSLVIGGTDYDTGAHHGSRGSVGYWVAPDLGFGIEGDYLFVGAPRVVQSAFSNGAPGSSFLAVPYLDVAPKKATTNKETSIVLASPGVSQGGASLTLFNYLQGAGVDFRFILYDSQPFGLMLLVGSQWIQLYEQLEFNTFSANLANNRFFATTDRNSITNTFFGGQIGLRGEYRVGNLTFNVTDKVTIGSMNEVIDLAGTTATNMFSAKGATQTFNGGIFNLGPGIGRGHQSVVTFVNELTASLGIDLNSWARARIGYSMFYLDHVMRPGLEMNHQVNSAQLPVVVGSGATFKGLPTLPFNESNFFAQGLDLGIEFRY